MHKVPFYGILISDIIGVKEYEFSNYIVKEKGIEVNKPHFDVGYIASENVGELIYRPTGVYIFGYSRQELLQTAKEWLRKHIAEIDVEIGRLKGTKSKLLKSMESTGGGGLLSEQAPDEPEHDYTIFLTAMSASYVALVVSENGGFRAQYTGSCESDNHAFWEGLHVALKNLHADSGLKVLLHSDDPDMAANFCLCSPTAKRIPYELMSLECFQGLSKLLTLVDIKVTDFDRASKEYAQCRNALMSWQ